MIPLLLIDELHSCKWQDKLIDQLVVGRCSISPKYPKLEVGEGIHFVLTRIQHFFIQTGLAQQIWWTHLGYEGEKKKRHFPLIVYSDLQNISSPPPPSTHRVDVPLVYFRIFYEKCMMRSSSGQLPSAGNSSAWERGLCADIDPDISEITIANQSTFGKTEQ